MCPTTAATWRSSATSHVTAAPTDSSAWCSRATKRWDDKIINNYMMPFEQHNWWKFNYCWWLLRIRWARFERLEKLFHSLKLFRASISSISFQMIAIYKNLFIDSTDNSRPTISPLRVHNEPSYRLQILVPLSRFYILRIHQSICMAELIFISSRMNPRNPQSRNKCESVDWLLNLLKEFFP